MPAEHVAAASHGPKLAATTARLDLSWSIFLKVVIARLLKMVLVVAVVLPTASACGGLATSAKSGAPPSGRNIKILVSGTAAEPLPSLTAQAARLLQDAAEADVGPKDPGSNVQIVTADGVTQIADPLTPRREDGRVEHGLQRDALEKANLHRVAEDVARAHATAGELDLLEGISRATTGTPSGILVLISNGLSTAGAMDLRVVGWSADPRDVVKQLAERDLLPDLRGWQVLWTGLNATAGSQPAPPKPVRDANQRYWTAICEASGAASCEFDASELPHTRPLAQAAESVVPMPKIAPIKIRKGIRISVPDTLLGFAGNSATLLGSAFDSIAQLAKEIKEQLQGQSDVSITITGYTADPPESRPADREELSAARAQAVADALRASGITVPMTVIGGGAAPGMSCLRRHVCVDALAEPMRRVDVEVVTDSIQ